MKNLTDIIEESLDETLQLRVDKAVKDMLKHDDVKEIVIIKFDDTDRADEIEQLKVYGPVATDCGKLYGIKK